MPRLVGKKSDNSFVYGLFLIAVVGIAGCFEYFGVVDVVPDFGAQKSYINGVENGDD